MKIKITEDTSLGVILRLPGTKAILSKYGLPCMHCPMAVYEMDNLKIGEVANTYGIELGELLNELNAVLEK